MTALRVLHVDTERGWRGGQQQVFSLVEGLARRGHACFAAVRAEEPLAGRLTAHAGVLPIRPFAEWDPAAALRVRRFVLARRIQVIHAHSGHAVTLALLASLGTGVPVVVTRRVDFPLARHPLGRWKYGRVARVIAISAEVGRVLETSGVPSSKIRLVPSGVDFRRYAGVRAADRSLFGLPAGWPIVGQVAALAPHKDQSTFLKAIAALKTQRIDVGAVLVGDGPLRAALETECRTLGLDDRVRFLGFRSDALSCLAAFDLFCLSSKTEGLGTSLIDAMALRVPIAATRAGGIPELIEDGITGRLANPCDPSDLARAIRESLHERNGEKLVNRAVEKARLFDIERTVSGTEAVYGELV